MCCSFCVLRLSLWLQGKESIEETRQIRDKQGKEYQESLKIDKEKVWNHKERAEVINIYTKQLCLHVCIIMILLSKMCII